MSRHGRGLKRALTKGDGPAPEEGTAAGTPRGIVHKGRPVADSDRRGAEHREPPAVSPCHIVLQQAGRGEV